MTAYTDKAVCLNDTVVVDSSMVPMHVALIMVAVPHAPTVAHADLCVRTQKSPRTYPDIPVIRYLSSTRKY